MELRGVILKTVGVFVERELEREYAQDEEELEVVLNALLKHPNHDLMAD